MLNATVVALLVAAAPNLVGKWQGDGFVIVLEANGTGTMSDGPGVPPEPLKWKVSGNNLLITQDGETVPWAMKLNGKDSMTLSGEDLDEPITVKRGGANAKTEVAAVAPQQPNPNAMPMGTCESACKHYLGCAKLKGDDQMALCQYNCFASGANPYQLGVYNQLDCKRAISIVVAAQLQALAAMSQANNAGSSGGNKGSRCNGCVRDGSSCVWISQGNWGSGPNNPYSGAVSSCDADCCQ
ncbi:MAG: hypothetical protein JNM17_07005 [Archangium sp.]|nr:hypothetical protein [Archangium sp.]